MEITSLQKTQIQIEFFVVASIDEFPEQATQYSAIDFGYEIDPQEMAADLVTQLPSDLDTTSLPEIEAQDFEQEYTWYLS